MPGKWNFRFKDLNYQGHVINSSPGVLTTNRFQHVAATYDRGSGDARLYVDGAIVARANLGSFTPRTIGDLYLGLRPYDAGAGLRYAGEMDEVSVYNRALSASEVKAIYHAGKAGKTAVPIPPFIVSRPSPPAMEPLESAGLPAGILEEDLNLDLNAAIQSYQSLINQFDVQRPMAANAVFRMAECYRRLGRMDEARSQYARVLREFADQAPLVKLSRKYANPALATGQMPADGASSGPHPADETATLEWQLAQTLKGLIEARLAQAQAERSPPKAKERHILGKVYVTGQVHLSGPYEIPDDEVFTVSKAILMAGGFSDFADQRHVRLIRGSPGQDPKNAKAIIINVQDIWEKGKTDNDVPVQADDMIYVPKRNVNF